KQINRVTEDAAGQEYFTLLESSLAGLNNINLSLELNELWFTLGLLKITGHSPNLKTSSTGDELVAGHNYALAFDNMAFVRKTNGPYDTDHIKILRLGIGLSEPKGLAQIQGAEQATPKALQLARDMLKTQLHL